MASSININQNNNVVTLQDNNGSLSITNNNTGTTVNVTQPVTNVVAVATPGPQGPIGPIPSSGAFTGSFSGSFTGSLQGTASNAVSASYALTASYLEGYISPFPYSGSAVITGSLTVSGSSTLTNIGPAIFSGSLIVTQGITGSLSGSALTATSASYALTASYALNGGSGGGGNFIATGSISASVSLGTGSFTITSGSSTFMFVSSSGNVGFGTTTPDYKLSINGKLSIVDGGDSIFIGVNAGKNDDGTSNGNTVLGNAALSTNVVGSNNIAIGINTLLSSSTSNNTAIGTNVLRSNTSGTPNTAIGSFSQVSGSTGAFNTSLGTNTLFNNTVGSLHTALGASVLFSLLTGGSNTGIGSSALFSLITGSENNALGRNAGRYYGATGTLANTDASASIFIGFNSRANGIGETNQIVIGNEALGLGSNTVVLGNSNITFTALRGNVGLGTTTNAGYLLDVNGIARIQNELAVSVQTGNGGINSIRSYGNDLSIATGWYFRLRIINDSSAILLGTSYDGSQTYLYGERRFVIGSTSINSSAILEAVSTTRGFLPPRTNLTSNISTPAQGLITYVTASATEGLYYYNGGSLPGWNKILTNSGSQDISGSLNVTSFTASNATISGNVTVLGTASINTLIVNQTQYTSGSNQLGDAADDFQTLYGTVRIPTGSLTVSGSITQNASTASFGGLVGIGTTTPSSALQIVGSTNVEGLLNITNNTSLNYANAVNILFPNTVNGNQVAGFYIGKALSSKNGWGVNYIHSSDGSNSNRGSIAFYGVDNILNWFASGNVTINSTTDAGYKLDVNGTARVSGAVTGTSFTATANGDSYKINSFAVLDYGDGCRINYASGAQKVTIFSNVSGGGLSLHNSGNVSIGSTATEVASAILNVPSTTKGFLPPRTNLTSNISTPAQGLMTYLTGSTNEGLYYYSSGSIKSWTRLLNDTGSQNISGSLSIIGSAGTGSALYAYKSGSTVVDIQGSQGQLFSVTDDLSNSLFSVNTIAGLPVIEAFATNDVNIGKYNTYPIKTTASGTLAVITGSISGSVTAPGSTTQIVYNNGGVLGANSGFVYNGSRVGIGNPTLNASLIIKGETSDSSTNAFFIQNAGATQLLNIRNDGSTYLGDSSIGVTWITSPTIFLQGNTGIGTFSPSFKLDVNGSGRFSGNLTITGSASNSLLVKGSGTTSATTTFLVQNSAGTTNFTIRDDGSTSLNAFKGGQLSIGGGDSFGANQMRIYLEGVSTGYTYIDGYSDGTNKANNAPIVFGARLNNVGSSLSGASTIENGTPVIFGFNTWNLSSIVTMNSTTRGFLPPRTNLTSNISSPAQGLMTYVTASATEGLYYYNSGSYQGWTRLLNETGSQAISGSLTITGSILNLGNSRFTAAGGTSTLGTNALNSAAAIFLQNGFSGVVALGGYSNGGGEIQSYQNGGISLGGTIYLQRQAGNVSIGSTTAITTLDVTGTGRFSTNLGVGRLATASLDIAGTTRISGSFNTAISGSILTVQGSGSAQPIFTVQGSQGELFSITDSLSGSLFSVNDISGLPILEVFSDNTTLIGNYQDPMLITTAKVVQTNSGSFTVYSLPTASYDTAFFEYSVRSGSNARAGTIMAIQSGSSVNFTETTTTDFGSTSAVSFTVIVTGSNMALTGSSTSGAWTIKTIVRGL
jgi:hypothetical protein